MAKQRVKAVLSGAIIGWVFAWLGRQSGALPASVESNRLYQENVVLRRLAQKAQMFYLAITAFWDDDGDRDQVAWRQSELLDALAEWTRLDATKEE